MFYNNYIRLCNSVNKTPSAVALEIGITKPTVSRWKSGSKPNYATAQKVADYFGVSVDDLLIESEKKDNPATQEGSAVALKAILDLNRFIAEASEEELLELVNMSDWIKSKRADEKKGGTP